MDPLLTQLVEGSPFGIVVLDTACVLQLVNRMAKRLISMMGEPLGRVLNEAIPIAEIQQLVLRQSTSCAMSSVAEEFFHGSRELRVRSNPLYDEEELKGYLLIIEDITEAKRVERAQRSFVANVSHELRTPTTSIAGFAQLLLEEKDGLSEDHAMMIEAIHRNAMRLNNLFDDLLTLSKIEANNEPLQETLLSLQSIVIEAVDKQRSRAAEKGVIFSVLVSEGLQVLSNRDALNHIVGNLVENAVKYSFDNKVVTIRAAFRNGDVQLEVIDLGEGISPANQQRIFERFFRVDKSRSRQVAGTGLGLAIVKTLLERTGIRLEVRSQVGKGSIFRVYLKPSPTLSASLEA